jgi:hypothetical protein
MLTLSFDWRMMCHFFGEQARRSMPGAGYNMQQQQQQQQVYDAPNCDYEPPKNFQQNFGNPYDCPEGFYNGSLMSSVGYSQVFRGFSNKKLSQKEMRVSSSFAIYS